MGGLKERTPLLEVLNLAENKIRDLDVIDEVAKLDNLQTLNLDENPLMVHRDIASMFLDQCKMLEIFNEREVRAMGSCLKMKNEFLK